MSLLIKGGRVLDPATDFDQVADVYIEEGIVKKIGTKLKETADEVIDAAGKYVMPGFVDLHVHLRDPGQTDKETIETGTAAACRGGYTTIVAMPNTKPVVDNSDVLSYVMNKAKAVSPVHVYQAGSITVGMNGEQLTDFKDMASHGAIAFSEDGKSVMSTALCVEAMKTLAKLDLPFLDHCEEKTLVGDGVVNDDENAVRLGLPGINNMVENLISSRDYQIATAVGARLHMCHVSTKEVVEMLRVGKKIGNRITCEVTPHHFTLTSDDIPDVAESSDALLTSTPMPSVPATTDGFELSNYKMNPPLRSKADKEAILEGLKDGTIDCIATDHAPHTFMEKNQGMRKAPFGIVGLETAASLTYTELVQKGILTPLQMAEKMSYNPARVLRLDVGSIAEGKSADLVIFDPEKTYTVDPDTFASKGRNTPFKGRKLTGQVIKTIIDGEIVYELAQENK